MKMKLVENKPIAKFFYKGKHSHPVRRTILVTGSNSHFIKGYELREGTVVRKAEEAPLKIYYRKKIALDREVSHRRKRGNKLSTLKRYNLIELLKGI